MSIYVEFTELGNSYANRPPSRPTGDSALQNRGGGESARLTRLRSGIFIEAFGERGCFPERKGLVYLPDLLGNPHKLVPAVTLYRPSYTRPQRDIYGADARLGIPATGTTVDDAIDDIARAQTEARIQELEHVLIPDLRDAIEAARQAQAVERLQTLFNARERYVDEVNKIRSYLCGTGRWPAAITSEYASAQERARTTTRANLYRCFEMLRTHGLRRTAAHFEDYISYRFGCWVYEADCPIWTVEWDL